MSSYLLEMMPLLMSGKFPPSFYLTMYTLLGVGVFDTLNFSYQNIENLIRDKYKVKSSMKVTPKGLKKIGEFIVNYDDSKIDYEHVNKFIYYKEVIKFIQIFQEKIPENLQVLMKRNINSLKIYRDISVFNKDHSGFYNGYLNEIHTRKISLFHELLHMSSAYAHSYNGLIGRSGISLFSRRHKTSFNDGFNEGLTELYTNRFTKDVYKKVIISYSYHVHFVELLEKILGEETLLNSYFGANFSIFYSKFSEYLSEEKIIELVNVSDELVNNRKDVSPIYRSNKKEKIIKMYDLLFEAMKNKLKILVGNNELSQEESIVQFDSFYNSINSMITCYRYSFSKHDLLDGLFYKYRDELNIGIKR